MAAEAPAPSPLRLCVQELHELDAAIDVDVTRVYEGGDASALRAALQTQAEKVAHEASRFAIVFRSHATEPAAVPAGLTEAVRLLQDAVTLFVSAVQLFTKPEVCGRTLRVDVRTGAHAIIRSAIGALTPLAQAVTAAREEWSVSVLNTVSKQLGDALLHRIGMVIKSAESFQKLPTTNYAAVRRKLLACGKLLKTSVEEISADQGIPVEAGTYVLPALHGSSAPAGAAATEPASKESASGLRAVPPARPALHASISSSSGGSLGRLDETNADDGIPPAVSSRATELGIATLRLTMRTIKSTIALVDVISKTEAVVANTNQALIAAMDDIAQTAGALSDAIIDYAAATNELSDESLEAATNALNEAFVGLRRQCGAVRTASVSADGAAASTGGAVSSDGISAAIADLEAALEAPQPYAEAALRVWQEYVAERDGEEKDEE